MAENNPHMPNLLGTGVSILRLALRCSILGQSHLNYLFYKTSHSPTTATELSQAALDIWSQLDNAWMDMVSEDFLVQSIVTRRIDLYAAAAHSTTRAVLIAAGLAVTGVQGGSCPPQDAYVFRKRTTLGGKRARGRWYIAGVAEDDHLSGQMTAAAETRAGVLASALEAEFVVGANTFSPFHCLWQEVPPPDFSVLEGLPIADCNFDTVIRSQRRRQLGKGI